ncbi:MAG: pilus assembly protein [Candidatus Rokubacteria bacterium]|nr:pilus assembly protein [Candidatus Rokubacteria bacterium]
MPGWGRRHPDTWRQAGTATLEIGFILPVFLLLTLGIFEFGRAWLVVNTLNHATREAVRVAATTEGLTADAPAVIDKAKAILVAAGLAGASVANTAPSGTPPEVTVTTNLNFAFLTRIGPILGFGFSGSIPLTASATMRYER